MGKKDSVAEKLKLALAQPKTLTMGQTNFAPGN